MRNQPFHIRNRQRHNRSRLVSRALPRPYARRRLRLRRRNAPIALIQRNGHIRIRARRPLAANRVMRMRRPLIRMQMAMRMRRADMQMPRLPLREMMVKRPSRQRRKQRNHPHNSQQPSQSRSNPFRNHLTCHYTTHQPLAVSIDYSYKLTRYPYSPKSFAYFFKSSVPPSCSKIPQK